VSVINDWAGFQGNFNAIDGRRMARTDTRYICLVPRESVEGDSVVLLEGGKMPLVIRRDKSDLQKKELCDLPRWQVVGEAYVHGVMKGEAFKPTSASNSGSVRCHGIDRQASIR
jgi:hypothetical protein